MSFSSSQVSHPRIGIVLSIKNSFAGVRHNRLEGLVDRIDEIKWLVDEIV
jgi:hypothetical protein